MSRRILVVGASSTLGLAVSSVSHADGDSVWATYRSPEKDAILAAALPAARRSKVDVLCQAEVLALKKSVHEVWGAVDGLVCAFGVGDLLGAAFTKDTAVEAVLGVNVQATFRIVREFYPLLTAGNEPSVVLISSVMGLVGAGGMAAYSASKSAVAALARSLAMEWASKKVRVNAVAPGIVPSPLVQRMFASLTPAQVESIRARHPLGFGLPEDVGHAVGFLLSPRARWITGTVLPVDGGYSAQ